MSSNTTGFADESVKSYMKSIAEIPRVSVEDEVELADLIAAGSEEARSRLITSNLRLVVKLANDFRNLGMPVSDLISEGNIGLMRAVEKFRPEKGAKFSSYGAWWIKQSMRRAIADQSRVIRIPVQSAVKIRKMQKAALVLAAELGRVPEEHEIAAAADISTRSMQNLNNSAISAVVSLSASLHTGEDGIIGDLIPDPDGLSPSESLNNSEVSILIRDVLESHLKEREKIIIKYRYGLGGYPMKTLDEVATLVGRTRERVRQIQHIAMRKIAIQLREIRK